MVEVPKANPIESEEVFHTYMALAEPRKSKIPVCKRNYLDLR
jgi:hypothetical protein